MLSDSTVVNEWTQHRATADMPVFIRIKGHQNTKYRPVRVGGDQYILYDYVVRIKHAEIR